MPFLTIYSHGEHSEYLILSEQEQTNRTTYTITEKPTMLRTFQQSYAIAGALSASHVFHFTAPFNMQLVHVSLCNESANAGSAKIGDASDDDCYLKAENFGVSSTPTVVNTPAGFDGVTADGQYPHIAKGSVVTLTITDHGSHMTAPCVVLTFTEG